MQRQLVQSYTYILEWGQGTCKLTKHTWRWTYSALLYFYLQSSLFRESQNVLNEDNHTFRRNNHFRGGAGGIGLNIHPVFLVVGMELDFLGWNRSWSQGERNKTLRTSLRRKNWLSYYWNQFWYCKIGLTFGILLRFWFRHSEFHTFFAKLSSSPVQVQSSWNWV